MNIIIRKKDYVADKRIEALNAQLQQSKADIEYLAMMTDVELDTEEDVSDEQ